MARTKYVSRHDKRTGKTVSMPMQEFTRVANNVHICPVCKRAFAREDMEFSRDCHGIPFRLLCYNCLNTIYEEKGYDGEYYTEADENIEEDY